MKNIEITLKRLNSDDKETKGIFCETSTNRLICESLERPKFFNGKENNRDDLKTEINESCRIPDGVYKVIWTYSPSFKEYLYEIEGVKSRSGIRIHKANVASQLKGCIAPCLKVLENIPKKTIVKYSKTDKLWADASGLGLQALYNFIGKDSNNKGREFTLTIISI